MEQRGRRSVAELAVISGDGIVTIHRPEAPSHLDAVAAREWREVVNRLPADWFPRETHASLEAYCKHVAAARKVAALIEQATSGDSIDIESYDRLLKMQERESRAMSSLATRMRMTQQSTMSEKKRKPAMIANKPWQQS